MAKKLGTKDAEAAHAPGYYVNLITRDEAAVRLGVSLRTLAQLLADGEIPVVRIAKNTVRIRPMALEYFVEARELRLSSKRRASINGISK